MALDSGAAGDLSIVIGGDLSPLEQALNEVPAAAKAAAEAVDASMADGLTKLDEAVSKLGADLGAIPAPATAAGDAIKGMSTNSEEAAGGLDSIKEHALSLAEELGLLIGAFEAIKMSLEAFATSQAFTMSMTALTGSAESAKGMLEELEVTAVKLPVAFDSLLQAAQKMQAFGIESEKIPEYLHAAADAAAATGNSFDTVAAAISRVAISGQVSARQLVQLGVSMQDVANTLGTTFDQAAAMMAKGAMDAQTQVDILVATVNTKFGGLSETMATSLAGAWQIIKNQFTLLFDQLGSALAPLAAAVAGLVSSVIVPALQGLITIIQGVFGGVGLLIQAFTDLGPVAAEVADWIGIIALAIGAISLAIDVSPIGIFLVALGAAAELFSGLSDHARTAAEAQKQQAEATKEESSELRDATQYLLSYGVSLQNVAQNQKDFRAAVLDASATVQDIGVAFRGASTNLDAFNFVVKTISTQVPTAAGELAILAKQAEVLAAGGPGAAAALEALAQKAQQLVANALSATDATKKLTDQHTQLVSALDQSKAALDAANQLYKQGAIGAGELATAQQHYNNALNAITGSVASYSSKLKEANEAQAAFSKQMNEANIVAGQIDTDLDKARSSFEAFAAAVNSTQVKLTPVEQALQKMQADIYAALGHWTDLDAAAQKHVQQLQGILDSYKQLALAAELSKLTDALANAAESTKNINTSAKDVAASIAALPPAVQAILPQMEAFTGAMEQAGTASRELKLNIEGFLDQQIQNDLNNIVRLIDAAAQSTGQFRVSLGDIANAWEKVMQAAAGSADAEQMVVDKMIAMQAPLALILEGQQRVAEAMLKTAQYTDQTGASELQLVQHMTELQAQTYALTQATMGLANLYQSVVKALTTAWEDLGKGIADAIVSGQNFGQVMTNVLSNLAKQILEQLIGFAFKQLASAILENTSLLSGFNTVFSGLFGAGGSVFSGLDSASKAMSGFASTAASSMEATGKAATTFAQQTTSAMQQAQTATVAAGLQMVSVLTAIGAVLGAIAGIFTAIELAHTNTLLTRIEESTRRLDITTEGAGVKAWTAIGEHLPNLDTTTMSMIPYLANSQNLLQDISDASTHMSHVLDQILATGGGTANNGAGGGAPSSAQMMAILTAINDGFARQAGLLNTILNAVQTSGVGNSGGLSWVINAGGGGVGNPVPGVAIGPPGISSAAPTVGGVGAVSNAPTPVHGVSGGGQYSVTVNVTAGTVVGANGAQQLAQMVGQHMVAQLSTVGGLKVR